MGKPTGFLDIERKEHTNQPSSDRTQHFSEFAIPLVRAQVSEQGARCMDCGIPFCHSGCPVNNHIPDWNDLVYKEQWEQAYHALSATNNFPEFTGRICPAPCEDACTLTLMDKPVTIKTIEQSIADTAWEQGWVKPQIPSHHSKKRVAIIGSGPAGLACGQQLARAGHKVVIYEKQSRIGGLLRYGIPNFKLDKSIIDRRLSQLQAEGIKFVVNTHIGIDLSAKQLLDEFDAVVLAGGAEATRDLTIPGRDLQGIHFAMDFLVQQNKRLEGITIPDEQAIIARDKRVVVLGGGDTGSDCVGTAIRQDAYSVTQLEIMPQPPGSVNKLLTWPNTPYKLVTTTSQEEGCIRDWSVSTVSFEGREQHVQQLNCSRVEWLGQPGEKPQLKQRSDENFKLAADLVILALGFVHPIHAGMMTELELKRDPRGNVLADQTSYQTSAEKVFCAGDMRRGQSLIVWAIREGRRCAQAVDQYLTANSK